jgi:hypothetical protein
MKYTKEILEAAAAQVKSVRGVLRILGIDGKKLSGGLQNHIASRLRIFGINTSHFTGQGSNLGTISKKRLSAAEILVKSSTRCKTYKLRRALLEIGVVEICSGCGLAPEWRHRKLVLQIDHRNGDPTDHRRENLRFLCPNCHSQTETFGSQSGHNP